jgi:hypothetical protein
VFDALVFALFALCVVAFDVAWPFVAPEPPLDGRFEAGSLRDREPPPGVFAGPFAVVNWPGPPPDGGDSIGPGPDGPLPPDVPVRKPLGGPPPPAPPPPPPGSAPPAGPPVLNEDVCGAALDGPPAVASPVEGLGMLMQAWVFVQISPLMCGVLDSPDLVAADADASDFARMARVATVVVETLAVDGIRD